jgi:DNA-binding transcriptional MerR regulator
VPEGLYRVGELSRKTGISVRNIREYQDRGLLTPPQRVGRIALYDETHIVRLELIERLLKRGYTIAVIRDLLDAWSEGRDLADVLGLEATVSKPWTDELPSKISMMNLRRMFGWQLTPAIIRRAVRMGILRPAGVRAFDVPSPRLLLAGRDLVAAGIPLRTVIDMIERVYVEIESPADRMIGMVYETIFPVEHQGGLPTGAELRRLTETVETLRPHAVVAMDAMFAQSLARAVDRRFSDLTDRAVRAPDHGSQAGNSQGA